MQKPAGSVPTTTQSYAYTLDLAGKRTQVSEADGTVRAYTYDSIDRLTGETVTGSLSYAKTFEYDPVGNRLTQTTTGAGAGAVTYRYDVRDQLTTENGTAYGYDPNGNVTSKAGEATYGWDFENRLTSATMSDGTVVGHAYDAYGNRVKTTVTQAGGGFPAITSFLVDTSGGLSQVVADTDGNGSLTALYVWNRDELFEVMRPAAAGTWTTRFVHSDGLGSVRLLTDETGTTVDARGYEAFGTKNTEAGNDGLTYGFAGEPFEGTSRLAYHRARWMDARVGRFASADPIAFQGGDPNNYAYGMDSPQNLTDPLGLESIGDFSAIVSGFGSLATLATPSFGRILGSLTAPPVEVWMRAFAPWKTFGLFGFAGDNRSFTTSMDVTSRISSHVSINTSDLTGRSSDAFSSPSSWAFGTDTAFPNAVVNSQGGGHLILAITGSNPLVPSWDIDASLDFTVTRKSATALCFSGSLEGDGFPDFEVFARDQQVQGRNGGLMMLTFDTPFGKNVGPLVRLAGTHHISMGSFSNQCIDGI